MKQPSKCQAAVSIASLCAVAYLTYLLQCTTNNALVKPAGIIYLYILPIFISGLALGKVWAVCFSAFASILSIAVLWPVIGSFSPQEMILTFGATPIFFASGLVPAQWLGIRRTDSDVKSNQDKQIKLPVTNYYCPPGTPIKDNDLVALVSHELSAPLASISASAELLLSNNLLEPERQDILGSIREKSYRLAEVVEQLLDLGRIQAGKSNLQQEPLAISPLISEALSELGQNRDVSKVQVHEAKTSVFAYGDAIRIKVALNNIVDNAIKYSPANSDVTIFVGEHNDKEVLVAVADQGIGIPADQLETLFERFHRIENNNISGHGLGLYIAKGFIEAQGGRIWVESKVSIGTTFYFTLPKFEG